MASAGENLNASQFYITLRDDLDYLDGKHTVFGEVAEGLETLMRINEAYVDGKSRPYKNIRIKHTYILDDPFEDPPQLAELIPDASPEGKPKDEVDDEVRLEDDWVPMDEQLNAHELEEVLRAKDAHSRAVVLESIGDIPDAEIKPPDNVLFVCKLNPVTEDEDLNTIFSRFGVVTSAEVIRDHKTGDSLCYAFIEFEDKDACEQAYFKMDNALIDDRRIHVDFSQSVAKLWSQYRRKGQSGGGCFKCGSLDHIAKDCTGDSKQPHSKYVLKDNETQRGGNGSTRYEMVFEEDEDRSHRHSKKRRDNENEEQDTEKHSKRHDDRRGSTHDWQRRDERREERREQHGGHAQRQRSPRRGGTKEYSEKDLAVERKSRDEIRDRDHKRRPGDDDTNERESRKRHGSDGSYKHRNDDKGFEKNYRADDGHGYKHDRDRKYENETKRRSGDEDNRGSRRDRHDFGEELYSDKRSSRSDHHHRRDHRGRK
ncbi:peptidyl-prolyl cis-trans isomerase CYP59 isoform X2 [Andrographis paniculata]|nr:peptidyl-prolyl cis-trans isomerase CYP59 isoform X2 [Andrographis paniculata]